MAMQDGRVAKQFAWGIPGCRSSAVASQGYELLAAGTPEGILTHSFLLQASGVHNRQAYAGRCLPCQLDWRWRGLGQVSCGRGWCTAAGGSRLGRPARVRRRKNGAFVH